MHRLGRLVGIASAVLAFTMTGCANPQFEASSERPIIASAPRTAARPLTPPAPPIPSAPSPVVVPPVARTGFDATIEALPPRFAGDDPIAVRAALVRMNLARGEFESSTAHQARLADLQDRQLVPGRTLGSVYAFSVPFEAPGRYDADAGVWPLYLTGPQWPPEQFANRLFWSTIGGPLVRARDLTSQESNYIGSNAFGAQRTVYRQRATDLRVKVCQTRETNCPTFTPQQLQMRISAQDAATVRRGGGLRMLVVGTLQEPFVGIDNWTHRPTMTHPMDLQGQSQFIVLRGEEFIIYRQASGEILHRIPITHPPIR